MNGLTHHITEISWEETITTWYMHVDDAYQRICLKSSRPRRSRGPAPVLSDSEVITMALIIKTFFQGHEEVGYAFVGQYLTGFSRNLIDLDCFNSRRRELVWAHVPAKGLVATRRFALGTIFWYSNSLYCTVSNTALTSVLVSKLSFGLPNIYDQPSLS
jgi:hypothetical protein